MLQYWVGAKGDDDDDDEDDNDDDDVDDDDDDNDAWRSLVGSLCSSTE